MSWVRAWAPAKVNLTLRVLGQRADGYHELSTCMLALDLARGDEASITRLRAGFAPATIACFEISGQWSLLSSASAQLTRFERAPTD